MNNININNIITNSSSINLNNKTKNLENKLNSSKKNEDELMNASKEFEAIFVNMLLKQMRSTVKDGGLTEKSSGRKIFESMYDEEISKSISEKGDGIGLAKLIYESMKNRI